MVVRRVGYGVVGVLVSFEISQGLRIFGHPKGDQSPGRASGEDTGAGARATRH